MEPLPPSSDSCTRRYSQGVPLVNCHFSGSQNPLFCKDESHPPASFSEVMDIDVSEINDIDQEIEQLISDGVVQRICRSQVDGSDRLVGIFRCDLEAGQNRTILQIPIHPPMANIPEVESVILNGSARTRISNCQKFGVRIEIVTSEIYDQPTSLFLETVIYSFQP